MALIDMDFVNGGIERAKWITPTVNGASISANWDYDAQMVILIFTNSSNNNKYIEMYDMNKHSWFASGTSVWTDYGVDNRITISPRSITATYTGLTITDASILPVTNKPNGYYT